MTEGYHYTKSVLDYVYLMNGYTVHDTPYGFGVSIQHTEQLYDAIAKEIIRRPNRMRGQEVRFLRGRSICLRRVWHGSCAQADPPLPAVKAIR
jgi:hypothetical protein